MIRNIARCVSQLADHFLSSSWLEASSAGSANFSIFPKFKCIKSGNLDRSDDSKSKALSSLSQWWLVIVNFVSEINFLASYSSVRLCASQQVTSNENIFAKFKNNPLSAGFRVGPPAGCSVRCSVRSRISQLAAHADSQV